MADQDSTSADGDVVNPWEVQSSNATGVDYDKLISMSILMLKVMWFLYQCL